ncbi:MAG: hypothetical protein ACTSPY_17290 [Candidatus Helarchaeota archaeon]
MIEENLVLTSSSIKKISLKGFFKNINKFDWKNIKIEINAMPRKDLDSLHSISLDKIPDSINTTIKSFKTPVESISISGVINECIIKLTSLVDKKYLNWIEINFKAKNKSILEPIISEMTEILKKPV